MIESKTGLRGYIRYQAWHEDGTLFYEHETHNQIQEDLNAAVIDALDYSTHAGSAPSINGMAIGTGANPGEAATGLTSMGTWECSDGTHFSTSQATESAVAIVATFTGWAGTVAEAGLFNTTTPSGLFAWDGSISVTLATSDSLQVTWTVTCDG